MKKVIFFISIFALIIGVTLFNTSIVTRADSSDWPPLESVSGWYSFTNVNSVDASALYWDYGYEHDNDDYPVTDLRTYTIEVNATLATLFIDANITDALGKPLVYSTISKIHISKAAGSYVDISFIFSNPGYGVEEEFVNVFVSEYGWVNDAFKNILFSKQSLPADFIEFLEDNGVFEYIVFDENQSDVTDLIITYVDIPSRIMHSMLDINVMGTTLFAIVTGIITIVFIVYLFKRIL